MLPFCNLVNSQPMDLGLQQQKTNSLPTTTAVNNQGKKGSVLVMTLFVGPKHQFPRELWWKQHTDFTPQVSVFQPAQSLSSLHLWCSEPHIIQAINDLGKSPRWSQKLDSSAINKSFMRMLLPWALWRSAFCMDLGSSLLWSSMDCWDEHGNHRVISECCEYGRLLSGAWRSLTGTVTGNAPKPVGEVPPPIPALSSWRAALLVHCSHRGSWHGKGHTAGWLKSTANLWICVYLSDLKETVAPCFFLNAIPFLLLSMLAGHLQ